MEKQKSFTLIELLVVIAIIGLLASIVMVNVNSARGKAKVAAAMKFSQSLYHALGADAVGVWDFDGNLIDNSGYGNNGTFFGGAPNYSSDTPYAVVGQRAGKSALSFDGDDYVDVGDPANGSLDFGTGDFSAEAWFKISAAPVGSYYYILGKA